MLSRWWQEAVLRPDPPAATDLRRNFPWDARKALIQEKLGALEKFVSGANCVDRQARRRIVDTVLEAADHLVERYERSHTRLGGGHVPVGQKAKKALRSLADTIRKHYPHLATGSSQVRAQRDHVLELLGEARLSGLQLREILDFVKTYLVKIPYIARDPGLAGRGEQWIERLRADDWFVEDVFEFPIGRRGAWDWLQVLFRQ